MPEGFFTASQLAQSRQPPSLIAQCAACGLYKGCHSPKMPVSGQGQRGILVVAEAPGAEEDRQGTQLVGEAGQLLRRYMRQAGLDLDRDCWKTNAIICRPPNNRTPEDKELIYCNPHLKQTLDTLKPRVIIPLGQIACKALLPYWWHEDVGPMERWAGWQIPLRPTNTWICPTYHPSYVVRKKEAKELARPFGQHLAAAAALPDRPYPAVPDAPPVYIELNPSKAALAITRLHAAGGPTSFDYETNMLKPDGADARIISCAICWRGQRTLAFPWTGFVVDAMQAYLRDSRVPKIGANIKFEERWTMARLGHRVRGWAYDTMLGAHVCDSRSGITSVAFQSFVRLGVASYDAHVKPYLRGLEEHTNKPNRVETEIHLPDLLRYNGMDAWCEYQLALHQRRELVRDVQKQQAPPVQDTW